MIITEVDFKDIKFNMCIPDTILHNTYCGGNVQNEILKNKVWAKDETLIMHKILNRFKGLVIDVGANTGYFSFIGLLNDCSVIAIEPNPVHTEYFKKTVEMNNFSANKVQHFEKFVSTRKEECIFDGWTGNDKLLSKDENIVYMVKTISLDEICQECVFLKIDVEGNEPDVIKSAQNLLSSNKIKYIMFEITYIMNDVIDSENIKMLQLLTSYGFTLYEIMGGVLCEVSNIASKVNKWANEYNQHHKKVDPSITNAGTNMLAIHKNAVNIFTKIKNTNNFYI